MIRWGPRTQDPDRTIDLDVLGRAIVVSVALGLWIWMAMLAAREMMR